MGRRNRAAAAVMAILARVPIRVLPVASNVFQQTGGSARPPGFPTARPSSSGRGDRLRLLSGAGREPAANGYRVRGPFRRGPRSRGVVILLRRGRKGGVPEGGGD